ncbi:MAG: hypothetical protein IT319_13660 [Anaerolineae bacterium]|nr:hypothetical protein [Anaerolineae bacterium]
MDILGIGGWELVAIFIIMLVVAGPKRMIQWSYTLGKYVAVLRKMWADTAQMLQKEFDDAGVDVKVPKNIPTRGDLNREIGRALTPVTKPLQETMEATKGELNTAKQSISFNLKPGDTAKPAAAKSEPKPTPAAAPSDEQPAAPVNPPVVPPAVPEAKPAPSTNGRPAGDFGTWSQKDAES